MAASYALVTGGSRGIGEACCQVLAGRGLNIVFTYRERQTAANQVVRQLRQAGREAHCVPCDLANPDLGAVSRVIDGLIEAHGPPQVLVHNAGITRDGLFAMMGEAAWRDVLQVNLGSFYAVVRPVVRAMLRQRAGRIVTIASVAGLRGNPGQVNYAASKAGLMGASRALALELAPRGITVNAVCPGIIETEMTAQVTAEALQAAVPMRRAGTPLEVAHVVGFLCSPEASYVTGEVLTVDGGLRS